MHTILVSYDTSARKRKKLLKKEIQKKNKSSQTNCDTFFK